MKEKDITQKVLEDNNDIFADIVNGLLFDGKSEVEENELVNTCFLLFHIIATISVTTYNYLMYLSRIFWIVPSSFSSFNAPFTALSKSVLPF